MSHSLSLCTFAPLHSCDSCTCMSFQVNLECCTSSAWQMDGEMGIFIFS